MPVLENFFRLSVLSLVRDRLLHLLFCLGLVALFLVPAFSMFTMRQVQELAMTLCLSTLSFLLLLVAILTGSSAIWRDVEKRYTSSLLGLPVSRAEFVLGKFCAIALLLAVVAALFGLASAVVVKVMAAYYPPDRPAVWMNFAAAVSADFLKSVMLLAFAFLFSAVSTSFYFPFLGAVAVYIAGSASQEVYEFVSGPYGENLGPAAKAVIKGAYFLLPNFAAFNLKAHAIYGLELQLPTLALTALYFVCYTGIILSLAVWSFSRRELP